MAAFCRATRRDLSGIRLQGKVVRKGGVRVLWMPGTNKDRTALSVSITGAKTAVARNREKRRFFEAVRIQKDLPRGLVISLTAPFPVIANMSPRKLSAFSKECLQAIPRSS